MQFGSGGFCQAKLMSRAQDLKQKKHHFNIINYILGPIFHYQAPFPSAALEVALISIKSMQQSCLLSMAGLARKQGHFRNQHAFGNHSALGILQAFTPEFTRFGSKS